MVAVLKNKNAATRLQIMVEIASSGPNIHQRTIAEHLGVTPQAISDYILQLVSEGMVISSGRSRYRLSGEGVNWVLKQLREINEYADMSAKAVSDLGICPAIAAVRIGKGDKIGLVMRDGVLYAVKDENTSATGVAETSAKEGEDVGISSISGLVEMQKGHAEVIIVPSIREGGSKKVSMPRFKELLKGHKYIAAVGIESLVVLRKAGVEPQYFYSVADAAADASKYGVNMLIVATSEEYPTLLKRLKESGTETIVLSLE